MVKTDRSDGGRDRLSRFRAWFRAAAVYNVAWGTAAILAPGFFFEGIGLPPPNYPALFQCIGMFVLVFAFGYWLLSVDPLRYAPFVWIALAGKTFGPVGFLYAAVTGELPWSFGWTILTNDLVWWPAFWAFAWGYARPPFVSNERAASPLPGSPSRPPGPARSTK